MVEAASCRFKEAGSLFYLSRHWKNEMKKHRLILFLLLCGGACVAAPVEIDFFFEPGCEECEQIEAELFPKIESQFGDACVVRPHDIGIETNFLTLLKLENAIGHMGPDRGYLIVNKQFLFGPNPSHKDFFRWFLGC